MLRNFALVQYSRLCRLRGARSTVLSCRGSHTTASFASQLVEAPGARGGYSEKYRNGRLVAQWRRRQRYCSNEVRAWGNGKAVHPHIREGQPEP